jgi:hypothetical protein
MRGGQYTWDAPFRLRGLAGLGFHSPTYLITFQNRLQVFIQWAIQEITFNRGARLITGFAPTDFNFNREVSGQRGAVDVSLTPTTSYRGN